VKRSPGALSAHPGWTAQNPHPWPSAGQGGARLDLAPPANRQMVARRRPAGAARDSLIDCRACVAEDGKGGSHHLTIPCASCGADTSSSFRPRLCPWPHCSSAPLPMASSLTGGNRLAATATSMRAAASNSRCQVRPGNRCCCLRPRPRGPRHRRLTSVEPRPCILEYGRNIKCRCHVRGAGLPLPRRRGPPSQVPGGQHVPGEAVARGAGFR